VRDSFYALREYLSGIELVSRSIYSYEFYFQTAPPGELFGNIAQTGWRRHIANLRLYSTFKPGVRKDSGLFVFLAIASSIKPVLINNLLSCDGVGTNVLQRVLLRASAIVMVCRLMKASLVDAGACAPFRQYLHRRLIASPRQ
jgi:hypothetical protein